MNNISLPYRVINLLQTMAGKYNIPVTRENLLAVIASIFISSKLNVLTCDRIGFQLPRT